MNALKNLHKFSWGLASFILLTAFHFSAIAQEASVTDAEPQWSFKLTPSLYAAKNETTAADVNVRGNFGSHTTWIGQYVRGSEYQQTRWGYEYNANFAWGQMVPSLQVASKGFVGASLNFQIGGSTYLITGLGRTNLKDYYNLTFDPNDSYVIGFGSKLIQNHVFNLFAVKDNRLHTGQVVTHGVWRWQLNDAERLVVDLSHKSGRLEQDAPLLSGHGISISYDFGNHFVKLAREQKVNFTDQDQTRISAGIRF